jgi:hypothetical protein
MAIMVEEESEEIHGEEQRPKEQILRATPPTVRWHILTEVKQNADE